MLKGLQTLSPRMNRLRLFDISSNLGDAKNWATHPATTTHQGLNPEERARLGIAVGDADDRIADLDRALG
jgi:O-succinylhomoserine sulfhydrylase